MAWNEREGSRLIPEYLENGKRYAQEKAYDKAVGEFERILKLSPGQADARFELGKVYFLQGMSEAAERELLRAVELNGQNAFAHLLLAKLYKEKGLPERSIEAFLKVLEGGYRDENVPKEVSLLYAGLKRFDKACEYMLLAKDYGYDPGEFRKDLRKLYVTYVRFVQSLTAEDRYSEAFAETQRAKGVIPVEHLDLHNSLLNETELTEKKLHLESTFRSITVTLTNRCNLRCIMCETRKKPWNLPERTKKELIGLMPYLERVMWQGGEAFLYEGFEELLDEAYKYRLRQVIVTNGMLITERMAEKLVRYGVELAFSIDGATKETYEHIRPGANFEKVLSVVAMINTLRERYNPSMLTRMNVLIMNTNYRQIEDFVEFAHKHKFTNLFFNAAGCDFRNFQENVFYYNQNADVLEYINSTRDTIAQKAKEYDIKLENWLPSEQFFEKVNKQAEKKASAPARASSPAQPAQPVAAGERKLFCHAPWQRLYVDCGGKMRPDCMCHWDRVIGDLNENSLKELWNGEGILEYRRRLLAGTQEGFCNNDCVYGRVPKRNLKYI